MKRCKDCRHVDLYTEYNSFTDDPSRVWCEKKNKEVDRYKMIDRCMFWIPKIIILTLAPLLAGCSPGQHHGHIYIHDPNHVEAIFDRPMTMSVDRDGVKVEASSMQPGFFEDIIKFLLLRPR